MGAGRARMGRGRKDRRRRVLMSPLDVEELARNLANTAASLQRHIEVEGLKVGAALGKNHAKAADERIKANAHELQRQTALVAELFQQRKPLERHSDRYGQIVRAVRAARYAGETTIPVETLLGIINAPFEPDTATDGTNGHADA